MTDITQDYQHYSAICESKGVEKSAFWKTHYLELLQGSTPIESSKTNDRFPSSSKTVYDLTEEQALKLAQLTMNDGDAEDYTDEEVGVDTIEVKQDGIFIPISFRCWTGGLWLSSSDKDEVALMDEDNDVVYPFLKKQSVIQYLETEGIW
jgi:hypothetical protein